MSPSAATFQVAPEVATSRSLAGDFSMAFPRSEVKTESPRAAPVSATPPRPPSAPATPSATAPPSAPTECLTCRAWERERDQLKASKAAVEASMEAMARLQKDQVARIVELEGQLKIAQTGRAEGAVGGGQ